MAVVHDLICDDCLHRWDDRVDPEAVRRGEHFCPACDSGDVRLEYRRFPGVMTASLPDGWRTKNDPVWRRAVEAADLEVERVNTPRNKREDIERAIKEVKGGEAQCRSYYVSETWSSRGGSGS